MSEALTAESLSGPLRSVAERLGMPFVFRLVEHFGGTTVAIPSGSAGKKQYRRLCGLSERQIWRILKQPRTPGEATQ